MLPHKRTLSILFLFATTLVAGTPSLWANIRGTQSTAAVVKIPVSLKIDIDLTQQKMTVLENGTLLYTWKISSGKSSTFRTPLGTFTPQWMTPMWYSRQWSWTPMPYAIFINEGVAIHGTSEIRKLGQPASKGCIRLSPSNAKILFKLVEQHGMRATRVTILGTPEYQNQRISSAASSLVQPSTSYPQNRTDRASPSEGSKKITRDKYVKYIVRYPKRLEISNGPQGSLSVYGGF